MESRPTSLPSLQMSQNWKEGSDQMLGPCTKLVPCIRTQDSRTRPWFAQAAVKESLWFVLLSVISLGGEQPRIDKWSRLSPSHYTTVLSSSFG